MGAVAGIHCHRLAYCRNVFGRLMCDVLQEITRLLLWIEDAVSDSEARRANPLKEIVPWTSVLIEKFVTQKEMQAIRRAAKHRHAASSELFGTKHNLAMPDDFKLTFFLLFTGERQPSSREPERHHNRSDCPNPGKHPPGTG
jgi:hypothetical protein